MPRPAVNSVAIEVTAHCNQKCDYCYNEWREDNGAAMGAAETDKLLSRVTRLLDSFDIDHVTITGGEPFARRDVFRLLDLVKSRGVGIQMISNGGLITDAIAERLATYGVHYVQVTLNGPDEALHEEHVGEGHFAKTLDGVRALTRHGVPVVGCVVVTKKNAARLGETLALWKSLGVTHISLSRFSPAGYAASFAARLLPSRSDLRTAFAQAAPFGREHGMSLVCTMPVPPCAIEVEEFAPIRFGTCPIGTPMQELALGPDGKLKNCTLHRTAIGGVADILDPSVDMASLLMAPEVTEYRAKSPAFCEGCLHQKTCGGGCGAAAEWVLGDARAFPDPFVWQHIDDDFAAKLANDRAIDARAKTARRHLETIR